MDNSLVVGFIGLGRMGAPMVANLLSAGHQVVVYDIDRDKCAKLSSMGANTAETPAAVAKRSDLTISMIMNDAILREVALGVDGVIYGAGRGHLFCDLSTTSPKATTEVAAAMEGAGVDFLCGRVAGSIGLAEKGELTVFASGDNSAFGRAEPALNVLGSRVLYVGEGAVAAYLKLVHSAIVGVYAALIGEALTLGEIGGVDMSQMLDILTEGPLGSIQLSLKAPMLKERSFTEPPSDIDTAAKDLDLVLAAGRDSAVPMVLTSSVRQLMTQRQAAGLGKQDIWSILETFESMAGLDVSETGAAQR